MQLGDGLLRHASGVLSESVGSRSEARAPAATSLACRRPVSKIVHSVAGRIWALSRRMAEGGREPSARFWVSKVKKPALVIWPDLTQGGHSRLALQRCPI